MRRLKAWLAGLAAGLWLGARGARRRAAAESPFGDLDRLDPGDPPGFQVLSLLAHELKTPVNVVVGYVELLADGIPEPLPATAESHVASARRASQDLAQLVNDLLTFVRLRSGQETLHVEMMPVAALVEEASVAAAERAAEKGIDFRVDAPTGLYVVTDTGKICQALRALTVNAVKFTDGGSVRVTVESEGEVVRFQVADTGIGIDPADHASIFEPHWQADRSVRRPRGGTGIGLALCREVARLLGGTIRVRSAPGAGSTFTLTIPRRLPRSRPAA